MKNVTAFVLGILAVSLIAGCGGTQSGKVLVTVNGDKITEGDIKFLGEINPRIQAQVENPAGMRRILDNLVEQNLLYDKAVKEGVNRDPVVKAKIDLYRRVIIAQSLIDAEIEKSAKKYYDEHQEEFKKLKLSEIFVKFATPDEIKNAKKGETLRSEEEALKAAEAIKARLDKGEDFAKVAQETSDDAASKSRGGDLGLISKDDKRMAARGLGPVVDKAFEMKVGEVAGPVKTDRGYYIVTVTRGLELDPFDEAKTGIMFKVRGDIRQDLLAKLKKDAKITYAEELAKAPAAPAGEPGAPGAAAPQEGAAAPAPPAPAVQAKPEAPKPAAPTVKPAPAKPAPAKAASAKPAPKKP